MLAHLEFAQSSFCRASASSQALPTLGGVWLRLLMRIAFADPSAEGEFRRGHQDRRARRATSSSQLRAPWKADECAIRLLPGFEPVGIKSRTSHPSERLRRADHRERNTNTSLIHTISITPQQSSGKDATTTHASGAPLMDGVRPARSGSEPDLLYRPVPHWLKCAEFLGNC